MRFYYPASALQLIRLLMRLRFDVRICTSAGDLTPRLLALGLGLHAGPGSKSVLTFHSGGYPSSLQGQTARPGHCAASSFAASTF